MKLIAMIGYNKLAYPSLHTYCSVIIVNTKRCTKLNNQRLSRYLIDLLFNIIDIHMKIEQKGMI